MRTAEDARVNEALEEAGEDLFDAEALARRPGGSSMSLYHCAQAAEKYLGALAVAADRKVNPMWDLPRVFEAVRDVEGMDALSDTVAMLAEFATPAKRATTTGPGAALRALRQVRREVLVRLGVDVPPEPEAAAATTIAATDAAAPGSDPAPAATEGAVDPDPATIGATLPREDEDVDRGAIADAPEPEQEFPGVLPESAWHAETGSMSPERTGRRGPAPAGRGPGERRTSYVKTFLMCAQCGVRIPRTRQTAQGRVPCPQCGRPMQPVQ